MPLNIISRCAAMRPARCRASAGSGGVRGVSVQAKHEAHLRARARALLTRVCTAWPDQPGRCVHGTCER
eukprot:505888-Pleurochrysis_carterae.AAC.2